MPSLEKVDLGLMSYSNIPISKIEKCRHNSYKMSFDRFGSNQLSGDEINNLYQKFYRCHFCNKGDTLTKKAK